MNLKVADIVPMYHFTFLALPSFLSMAHPLYQDMFSEALMMLSLCHPEPADLLLDIVKPGLAVGVLGGVNLVGRHDELLDPEGVGEQGVLPGLPVLGDSSLELTSAGGDDENSTVSLGQVNC